jgi:hypothetical protein
VKFLFFFTFIALLAHADETIHFTKLGTFQGQIYNGLKGATYKNHKRTHIQEHPYNEFYSKYTLDIDTLIATKYPTMTFYKKDPVSDTVLTSSVDNNCSMPFNIANEVKGIDITPVCRAHDYCYMSNDPYSTDLKAAFDKCNKEMHDGLKGMCDEKFTNEDVVCEDCEAQKELAATNNSFESLNPISDMYADLRTSFHNSGCRTDMYLIAQSVGVIGYEVFLNSQERAAQFTLDLVKLAIKHKGFAKDLNEVTGVDLDTMINGYINYCFSIVHKGYGEGYSEKKLSSFAGHAYKGYEVEKDLGNYSACNEENRNFIISYQKNK